MSRFLCVITALCLAIVLVSCGKSNPVAPQISGLEQLLFSEEKLPADGGQFIYRQGIQVNNPAEGNLYSYCLTTYADELPAGFYADEQGWLYFRTNGTDSTVPLSQPGNHRSIWTSQSYISADFASVDGKISNLITAVELRNKSTNGDISQYCSAFRSDRIIGSRIVNPASNGMDLGTGVEFVLQETIGDIFVDGLYAHHFMFRLNLLDSSLQVVSIGAWHSSLEMPDMRRVILNSLSAPAIHPNAANQFTQFESYVVSRNGIEEATHQTVYFKVVDLYEPVALIYPETVAGLGQYHYSIMDDDIICVNELIPANSSRKNRRLFTVNNQLEAINSPDFKLHLRWGYAGQYGVVNNDSVVYTNNPWDSEINATLSLSDHDYHSRIVAFDLRFDDQPFPIQPHFVMPETVTHNDGTSWLRVNNLNDSARHHIFSGLSSGMHQLQVCVVDLQGVISAPAAITINLKQCKPISERYGILVVDDTPHHNIYAPETYVDHFYMYAIPSLWGAVSRFQIEAGVGITNKISPTQMQEYKAVVWHCDNPNIAGNMSSNVDAMEVYLAGQGILLLSGTQQLVNTFDNLSIIPQFLPNRFGLISHNQYGQLAPNSASNPFFIKAIGLDGLEDIDLNLDAPFNALVAAREGLSTVSYFNPGYAVTYLQQFGCKPVDAALYPPTQEQYDLYSSKFVAYKHSYAGGNVVVFGFPLSYMVPNDVTAGLQSILNDILNNSANKGAKK